MINQSVPEKQTFSIYFSISFEMSIMRQVHVCPAEALFALRPYLPWWLHVRPAHRAAMAAVC